MPSTPYGSQLGGYELRVVRISPGQWGDPVVANLITCELSLASIFCPYTALSYVWGAGSVTDTIYLEEFQFHVTLNLLCALRHLRKTDEAILLWVDALCINQRSKTERNEQVRIMQNIYQNAQQVVVFIGDSRGHRVNRTQLRIPPMSPETTLHGDGRDRGFLDDLLRRCQAVRPGREVSSITADICAMGLIRGLSDQEIMEPFCLELMKISEGVRSYMFECLRAFVVCPWWARIWVVQEITVNNTVAVRYGNITTSWQVFVQAANTWSMPQTRELAHRVALEEENIKVLELFENQVSGLERTRRRWRAGGGTSLVRLLQEFSHRQASDDRDKVYGLLSLAKKQQKARIDLDYSGNVLDTYRNTALALIKTEASLACWFGDQRRKNHRNLPSWVPDWSTAFDLGDRNRMEHLDSDCYEANHGWTLTIADTETSYWSAVSIDMERLLDSLAGQSGRLPESLRPFLSQYIVTLNQLKEKFTRALQVSQDKVNEPKLRKYLKLCKENGALSVSDRRTLETWISFLDPWPTDEIAVTRVKNARVKIDSEGTNIRISCDVQRRPHMPRKETQNMPSEETQNIVVDYHGNHHLAGEWFDEHIMERDLGVRRTAIRKVISQCDQLSSLCTAVEAAIPSRRLFKSSFIFRRRTSWLGGVQQQRATLEDWESYQQWILTRELDNVLIIQTITVDCVIGCGARLLGWADKKSACSILLSWFDLFQQSWGLLSSFRLGSPPSECGSLEAFAETLLGGLYWRRGSSRKAEQVNLGPLEDWLRSSLKFREPSTPPNPFFEVIEVATDGRVFFLTKNGSMGLGPASIQKGDKIHILPGGQTHFALRSMPTRKGLSEEHTAKGDIDVDETPEWIEDMSSKQHELVGDCYLRSDDASINQVFDDEEAAIHGSLPFEFLGGSYLKGTSSSIETIMLI